MRWPRSVLAATALLLMAVPPATASTKPPRPLFAATGTLHLRLRAPFNTLEATNGRSAKPVPGTLTEDGAAPEMTVALSTRGVTRGSREICPFPPLRVDFPQSPAPGSTFAGQHSLKLVTHCQDDAAFQHYVLLEYAAYRIYQLFTPASFGVRLASIDYVSASGQKLATRVGFFIEDVGDLARRNGLKHTKIKGRVAVAALNAPDAARFAMFEYLIGNLDWAMTAGPAGSDCCHNARLIADKGATSGLVPVPYDFDFSGLVDAPYATPPQGIPLPNIRVRKYRGFCRHDAEARVAAGEMLAQRAAITGVIDATPDLASYPRQKARQYLAAFFDEIGKPARLNALLKTCLK